MNQRQRIDLKQADVLGEFVLALVEVVVGHLHGLDIEQQLFTGQQPLRAGQPVSAHAHRLYVRVGVAPVAPTHVRRVQVNAVIEEAMSNFHRYFFIMPSLARLELEIHERVERGGAITAGYLNDLMADLMGEVYPRDQIILGDIGAVIGAHAGPRTIGVTFFVPPDA